MREILFRGKRIDNGEWVVGKPWIFAPPVNKAVIVYAMGLVGEDDDVSRYCECHEVNPSTISEFTGLTDKNGKKIFEGDILKYSYRPPVIVVWHSGGWYFTDEDDPSKPHPDDFIDNWGYTDKEKLEIIGNIHDNFELLEEQT